MSSCCQHGVNSVNVEAEAAIPGWIFTRDFLRLEALFSDAPQRLCCSCPPSSRTQPTAQPRFTSAKLKPESKYLIWQKGQDKSNTTKTTQGSAWKHGLTHCLDLKHAQALALAERLWHGEVTRTQQANLERTDGGGRLFCILLQMSHQLKTNLRAWPNSCFCKTLNEKAQKAACLPRRLLESTQVFVKIPAACNSFEGVRLRILRCLKPGHLADHNMHFACGRSAECYSPWPQMPTSGNTARRDCPRHGWMSANQVSRQAAASPEALAPNDASLPPPFGPSPPLPSRSRPCCMEAVNTSTCGTALAHASILFSMGPKPFAPAVPPPAFCGALPPDSWLGSRVSKAASGGQKPPQELAVMCV